MSLLSVISKTIIKIIHRQTSSFSSNNENLYNQQSGFRKIYSPGSRLTFLLDKIFKGFDKSLMTDMILIDLQKAFNTIDHDIPLKKLRPIGFSNHTTDQFKSFKSTVQSKFRKLLFRSFKYCMWSTTRVHSRILTVSNIHQ